MVKVEDIKRLREITGAGIADCKEALSLLALSQPNGSKGNINKAVEYLKRKGIEKAEKKAERDTGCGRVFSYVHGGKIGVLVSLLCETDFVAKTDEFQNLGKELCLQIASMNPQNMADLLKQEYIRDPAQTIDVMIKTVIGKLGENIKIGEYGRISL